MAHELEVVARKGAGGSRNPPLLFVHGAAHGAWCWAEHFLGFFADRGFDAYALSLRGHGGSGGREWLRWTSVADYVDDVERVATGLPREPVVVGHSMGGMVAAQYLSRRRPPAAALLAPAPPGGMPRQWVRLSADNPWLTVEMLLTLEAGKMFSTPARARKFLFSPELGEDDLQRHAARLGRESIRALIELSWMRPDPARFRGTPLLVLGAARDYIIPPEEVMRTADVYGAESRILPDIAHDLMLDTGWPRAADALLAWLAGTLA